MLRPEPDTKEAAPARLAGLALLALVGPLAAIYIVSQFLRNAVGVIAPDLARTFDLPATGLGALSSAFFLAFALAQIPVGIAIDRYGPRMTMLVSALLCTAAIAGFALAPSATALVAARALMGVGCASFFMGSLAILARERPAREFPRLTALMLGIGSIGTLAATAPLASASAAFGWRTTFVAAAAITFAITCLVFVCVPDDRPGKGRNGNPGVVPESWSETFLGIARAMRVPHFWPVFLMHFTSYPAFVTVIGLWGGPWLADVAGLDLTARGNWLLAGVLTQIAGLFLWVRLEPRFGGLASGSQIGAALVALWLFAAPFLPADPLVMGLWLAGFGVAIAYTPLVTAHGKTLFPPQLVGRGLTLLNLGMMGGAFLTQLMTGALMDVVGRGPDGTYPPIAYGLAFAALGIGPVLAAIAYRRVPDPR